MALDKIVVRGAKVHNLKNLDVEIPRDKLTVLTGLSGSGKSSLAFDTIYAEGQRRYVESLSTYARQFLQSTEKAEVESIEGLSPAISIDQKTTSRNPRSTVGTVTEIYDFLRLLFAKIGKPHCPECGREISHQTHSQILESVAAWEGEKKIMILAPVMRGKKGECKSEIEGIKSGGFVRYRLDGVVRSVLDEPEIDPKKKHTLEIVVDRLVTGGFGKKVQKLSTGREVEEPNPQRTRLADSLEVALRHGKGLVTVAEVEGEKPREVTYSEHFACSECGVNIEEIEPRSFSFNSPHGACPECHGLGSKLEVDPELVVPNSRLSINEGAILPWNTTTSKMGWYLRLLEAVARKHGFDLDTPVGKLSKKQLDIVLFGDKTKTKMEYDSGKFTGELDVKYEGVIPNLQRRYRETDSDYIRRKIEDFMRVTDCPVCGGKRLKPEVLAVKLGGKSIIDVTEMAVSEVKGFFQSLKMTVNEEKIAKMILDEVCARLDFLKNVGLSYLTLNRSANTLSGGEAQRIRLATQIGSHLLGVLYVLDEPSIGLHQRDNDKLIKTLLNLRDVGNTVIVVEHDEDTIEAADHVIDIGPGAGKHGGQVVAEGSPKEIMKNPKSLTGMYMSGKRRIEVPGERRKGNGKYLEIKGAREHNLKNVSVKIPLGKLVAVTGVSGSGKSSLVNYILVRQLLRDLNNARTVVPGKHEELKGAGHLDKIIDISQEPIGRTPRSNPATYTGVFTDIRNLFAQNPEAKLRGYQPGRFSFNVKGGRCESCQGDGIKKIEMHFLPDIYVPCEECGGSRYNPETLEITWRGKNIAEVLDMTVEDALEFFSVVPSIKNKLETLNDVGLGYIHLGQSATTLSGGEAQRVKLANELARRSTGKTIYVLDEPTTGLHTEDVKRLSEILHRLVEMGNTVVTIEHNLHIIKQADWVIDLGPEGGSGGGEVIAEGTPEEVAKVKRSYTGVWLKKVL